MNSTTKNDLEALSFLIKDINKYHIKIEAANDFILPKDWGFKNRINYNFHIAIVKSGGGNYHFNNATHEMNPNRVYFISPFTKHDRYLDLRNIPRLFLLRFSLIDYSTKLSCNHLYKNISFSYIFNNLNYYTYQLDKILKTYLHSNYENKEDLLSNALKDLLYNIHKDLIEILDPKYVHPEVKKLLNKLKENLYTPIKIDKLVAESNLSANYIRRCFKEHTSMSIKHYLLTLKIKESTVLLCESSKSINEISKILGFCDAYAFSKQFKNIMGLSPNYYRKQAHES